MLDDLKSEEIKRKVLAARHLGDIAQHFGPEKTKQQLIPFLKEFEDEEEDVLIEVAGQMPALARILPSKETSIPEFLLNFQMLLSYEDYSVINAVN